MIITLNGQKREVENELSIQDLLIEFDLVQERVAVEQNGTIIDRANFASTSLSDGDKVEIVRFVGGG